MMRHFQILQSVSVLCKKERKKIGLCEEQWLKLHLKMKLFRLGRLQFEPDEGESDPCPCTGRRISEP